MKRKRKEFTENQKAEIYVRDCATCAFSGISLWLLDNGIKSNWEIDWADHIKPSAAGGKAELENGICASSLFNSKKKANANDNIYFVKNGKITKNYALTFGTPPFDLIERLTRLKKLQPEDWFFNRSISRIFAGYDWRCDREFKGLDYKRTDEYWFKSGWNSLQKYHKKKGKKDILERGLVKKDIPFGTEKLLKLDEITDEKEFYSWIEKNYLSYRESFRVFFEYFNMNDKEERVQFILKNNSLSNLHPEVIKIITAHNNCCNL